VSVDHGRGAERLRGGDERKEHQTEKKRSVFVHRRMYGAMPIKIALRVGRACALTSP
jgi:hypothetical protein